MIYIISILYYLILFIESYRYIISDYSYYKNNNPQIFTIRDNCVIKDKEISLSEIYSLTLDELGLK